MYSEVGRQCSEPSAPASKALGKVSRVAMEARAAEGVAMGAAWTGAFRLARRAVTAVEAVKRVAVGMVKWEARAA